MLNKSSTRRVSLGPRERNRGLVTSLHHTAVEGKILACWSIMLSRLLPFFRWLQMWSCLVFVSLLLSISSWRFYILFLLPFNLSFIQSLLDRERFKSSFVVAVACLHSQALISYPKKSSRLAELEERTFASQPSNDHHPIKRRNTWGIPVSKKWSERIDADFWNFGVDQLKFKGSSRKKRKEWNRKAVGLCNCTN